MSQDYPDSTLHVLFDKAFEQMDRIEEQTKKTNGRVTELESINSRNKGWVAGFGVLAVVVVSLISYIFSTSVSSISATETKTQEVLAAHINQTR